MKLSIFCCIVCKTFPIMMQNKKVSNTDLISSPQVWISNKSFAFSTVLKQKGVGFMLIFFLPTQNSAGQSSFSMIFFLSPKAARTWLSWMNLCKYIRSFLPEKKHDFVGWIYLPELDYCLICREGHTSVSHHLQISFLSMGVLRKE